jgi:hypothetical protein
MSKNRFSLNGDGTGSPPPPDDSESRVAAEMTQRLKKLTAVWDDAEKRLRKLHVPVEGHVCYKSEDVFHNDRPEHPTGAQIHSYLGFVKFGSGWRICYCRNHDDFPEYDWEWKPVVDCTYDVRLEAFPHFEKLLAEVIKKAEECIPKLDNAIAAFRKIVEKK